jgi:hypothetical protein
MALLMGMILVRVKFNIFVLTDDPATAFSKAHQVVVGHGMANVMRSAYRAKDGEDYIVLWPSTLNQITVLWLM